MTLDISLSHMIEEFDVAEKARDDKLDEFKGQLERYHGPAYDAGSGTTKKWRENHYHDWISLVVPQIIYNNPKCRVGTRRQGLIKSHAQALHHGINRWIRDNNLRKLLVDGPALDIQFNWTVLMVSQEPMPGADPREYKDAKGDKVTGVPHSPKGYHIPQDRFLEDPGAMEDREIRWRAHLIVDDKENVLDMAREDPETWNLDVAEKLCEVDNLDTVERHAPDLFLERNQVCYYEVWVPEVQQEGKSKKDGYHGSILTIARTGSIPGVPDESYKDHLRPPRAYYGPPCGPYHRFGIYHVPKEIAPLGPLTVLDEQIKDLNRHDDVLAKGAAAYKRLFLYDDAYPDMAEKLKDGEHDFWLPVKGLQESQGRNVLMMEFGGITEQMLAYRAVARERLDRHSAVNDAKRGQAQGGSTATENAIADASANVRMGFIHQQFEDGVIAFLRKILWYLHHDNRVAFPLGAKSAEEMGMEAEPMMDPDGWPVSDENGEIRMVAPEPWFEGGMEPGEKVSFEDLELEIEPYSMRRTDDAAGQARLMNGIMLVTQLAPLVGQIPYVDWEQVFNDAGEALNIPDFGDRINVEMAMKLFGMQLEAGMQQQSQGPDQSRLTPYQGQTPNPSARAQSGGGASSPPGASALASPRLPSPGASGSPPSNTPQGVS